MKRINTAIVAFFLCVVPALAQWNDDDAHHALDILVGGKAGVAASTLTGKGGDYRLAPCVGVSLETFFLDRLALAAEISYCWQGTNNVMETTSAARLSEESGKLVDEGPYDYRLSYLNADYLLKYFLTKRMDVYTGIHMARLTRARAKAHGSETNIRKSLHRGDFAIPFGVEYEYKKVTVDARYNLSFRKIAKDSKARMLLGDAKNSAFLLTVGYKLQIF